jgi:hypothetical protein
MTLGGEIFSSGLGTAYTFLKQFPALNGQQYQQYERLVLRDHSARSDEEQSFAGQEIEVGQVKFNNFALFASIYPEYDYVFFGDSGQADAYAARLIMEHNANLVGRGKTIVTFIHDLRIPASRNADRGLSPTGAVRDAIRH